MEKEYRILFEEIFKDFILLDSAIIELIKYNYLKFFRIK